MDVTQLLENRSLLFSENLQLVSKRDKMFQALILKKKSYFGQKTVQNWPFWIEMPKTGGFSHFFAIRSLKFSNFFTKPSLWSLKKGRFPIFWEN